MNITDLFTTTILFLVFVITPLKAQSKLPKSDVVIVLDVSSSMLSEDFTPNRLEAGKKALSEFIDNCKESRIGLVVFAGEARTRCSITDDYQLVQDFLNYSKCGVLESGTGIEHGIVNAIDNLKESEAKQKVIILLTDGVNNVENTNLSIIPKANDYKITVYAICLGRWNTGVTAIGFKEDGKPILGLTELKVAKNLLTKITQKTGGRFFLSVNSRDLKFIFTKIHKLERFTKK